MPKKNPAVVPVSELDQLMQRLYAQARTLDLLRSVKAAGQAEALRQVAAQLDIIATRYTYE